MSEPEPVYQTDNPFAPYLTDGDLIYIKSEMDELFKRSKFGALVLIWNNGELELVKTTVSIKRPK